MRALAKVFLLVAVAVVMLGACAEKPDPGYMYPVQEFRIFYDLEGPDALPAKNQVDSDGDKIPDYVENMAYRLFKVRHPLESERYRDQATHIDVVIRKRDGNGSAGDAVTRSRADWGGSNITGALWISLSTDLSDDTLTPAHELFHLFQNGYTMFKNRWFTEGTARWVQYAFEPGTGSEKTLPDSPEELQALFERTYSARFYWRRLFRLVNPELVEFSLESPGQVPPEPYPEISGAGDLYGVAYMRTLLERLDEMDNIAARKRGLPQHKWEEELQKSPDNNPFIVCAMLKSINDEKHAMETPDGELPGFIRTLASVDSLDCDVERGG
jgi:hypothetical protein